ncbi:UTP--glucose-1-phosphate uridylyltransferase GalU [Thermoanaerobacter mathranii]|uniref:UTP--glucose-1-phosphate uridylyltransferase GalU n=1 Tax=Thermoanaerobacter mathranii TaxID=583357 RepID=UPI003D6C4F99
MEIKKAVIPAAGLGTRFLPITKTIPKEMLPIVDKPVIHYIVEEAVNSGIKEILIITNKNKKAIEDYFDKFDEIENEIKKSNKEELLPLIRNTCNLADIYYVRQKELKGLGHAISCAKAFVGNQPFAVLLGDDLVDSKVPCLKQLINCYSKYNSPILGVQAIDKKDVVKYGIIDGIPLEDGTYKVKSMVEKPKVNEAPSNIAVLGRYILTPQIFDILEKTEPGKNGEVQLTDALKVLAQQRPIYAYHFEGKRYDIGDKFGFLQANIDYALKRKELRKSLIIYLQAVLRNLNKV